MRTLTPELATAMGFEPDDGGALAADGCRVVLQFHGDRTEVTIALAPGYEISIVMRPDCMQEGAPKQPKQGGRLN